MHRILLLIGIIIFSEMGLAQSKISQGGSDVGGGMGVVCRNDRGDVESVELLDLWEAREIYGRKISASSTPVKQQVDMALDKIKYSVFSVMNGPRNDGKKWADVLKGLLKNISDRLQSSNNIAVRRIRGVHLEKTNDSHEVATPRNCNIEQLIRYADSPSGPYNGMVFINQDLVDRMDPTNVAALYIHEALYSYLRPHEKSSLRVRRAVGLAFSAYPFQNFYSLLSNKFYSCTSKDMLSEVVIYESSPGQVSWQVIQVDGLQWLGFEKSNFSSSAKSIDDFMSRDKNFNESLMMNPLIGYDYGYLLKIKKAGNQNVFELQLSSAPDREPSSATDLKCKALNKY